MCVCVCVVCVAYRCSSASFYVKVMKKILDKGSEYVKKEYERLGRHSRYAW